MANSKIKQILVGTTTYDIEDASAVHLSSDNTFTGSNTFSSAITAKQGIISANGDNLLDNTKLNYNNITRHTNNTDYTLTIPAKSGTLVTEDDLSSYVNTTGTQSVAGQKTFTGNVSFSSSVNFSDNVACSGAFRAKKTKPGTGQIIESSALSYDSITRYKKNNINEYITYKLSIPARTGTLALIEDIQDIPVLYRHEISVAANSSINDSIIIFTLYSSMSGQYNTVGELPPFDMMGWYYDGNDVKGAVRITHNTSADPDVIHYSGRLLDPSGNIGCDFTEEPTADQNCVDTVYSPSGDLI